MKDFSKINKIAWEYKSYEFWIQNFGTPKEYAKKLIKNPEYALRLQKDYLGDINGKKIASILGSNGRKAIPLALLGADVTVIDISKENMRYALELAEQANVSIRYELCDFLEFDTTSEGNNDFDILFLEGGILHYFDNINAFTNKLSDMLKIGGHIVLHDFHPFRKIIQKNNGMIELKGDYFNNEAKNGEAAYAGLVNGTQKNEFPKCRLRYYTLGEIITSIADSGFHINKLIEKPRYDEFKNLPGSFLVVATKGEI